MMKESDQETLLEFPCTFSVKAMGRKSEPVREVMEQVILKYVPADHVLNWKVNESGQGNFIAVTASITASDKGQLDYIYHGLTDAPEILVAL